MNCLTKFLAVFSALLTLSINLHAQDAPPLDWSITFGEEYNDLGRAITICPNGDLLSGGITDYRGLSEMVITRITADGDSLWQRRGYREGDVDIWSMLSCQDGGYSFCGYSDGYFDRFYYFFAAKIDEDGEVVWQNCYGEEGCRSSAHSMVEDEEGNLYLAGAVTNPPEHENHHADFGVVKISPDGDMIWSRRYGDLETQRGQYIIPTSDGNFVVGGDWWEAREDTFTNPDCNIVKIDPDGNQIWSHHFGTQWGDQGATLFELPNGNVLMAGLYYPPREGNLHGVPYTFIIEVTAEGDSVAWHEYPAESYCVPRKIIPLDNGDYLICGTGFTLPQHQNRFWFLRLTPDFEQRWSITYGGSECETLYDAILMEDRSIVAVGATGSFGNGTPMYADMWIVRTAVFPVDLSVPVDQSAPSVFSLGSAYPNPFNSRCMVSFQSPFAGRLDISLMDGNGRIWSRWTSPQYDAGEGRLIIDGSGLSAGVYWVKVAQGENVASRRVVLVK